MAALIPVHGETISAQMRQLLQLLGQQPFMDDFYLAGGTALALREGHRYSIDLDFFSATNTIEQNTRQAVIESLAALNPQLLEDVDGNLLLWALDIHVGFFGYGYPLLAPTESVLNKRSNWEISGSAKLIPHASTRPGLTRRGGHRPAAAADSSSPRGRWVWARALRPVQHPTG
ncbi:MAG: nucleotidyl transferase AbiEii/AbiGii toxin family protein [Caldilineaceae bacterium]